MAFMSARERIEVAISLGKPDRVPIVPMVDIFSGRYAGILQHDTLFDKRESDKALMKVYDGLGPFDGYNLGNGGLGKYIQSLTIYPPSLPGVDGNDMDALWQFNERTIMEAVEYADLAADPGSFMRKKAIEHQKNLNGDIDYYLSFAKGQICWLRIQLGHRKWRRKGLEPLCAANNVFFPLEQISMMFRSYKDFVTDLYRFPDELKAASAALMKMTKPKSLLGPKISGVKRAFIGLTRTSSALLSPKQFEEFALPELTELVDFLIGEKITPVLHMDNDWTDFLHYFKEFPAGQCVINLDGSTDIFKAKEIFEGHSCIMGDVPATLLKLGEPDEVTEYCERIIKEIGVDGGFILSSGCEVPIDAKPENVKAMLRSAYRFGRYPIK